MRFSRFLSVIVPSLVASLTLQAQGLDPAARLLVADPAALAPVRSGDGPTHTSADASVSVYIQYDPATFSPTSLSRLDARLGVSTGSLATVTLPLSQLASLASLPGVTYVQAAKQAHLALDLARAEAFADDAQAINHPVTLLPFSGQGVVIGQVDAGLDYLHNAFRTADGQLRISRVWEQGTNPATASIRGLHSPEPYGYGAEFDTPELILEARGDSEAGSHGTHVMGIAAGSDSYLDGRFHGLAPEAELVMVALSDDFGADNVRVSDAIQYIFAYADSVQKPCVVNLSLGTNLGPHDGTSPFDQIADALQGPGRLIVAASGNYGYDQFHISRTFAEPIAPTDAFQAIIPHEFYSSYVYGEIDLWADPSLDFTLELFDYNTFSSNETEVKSFTHTSLTDGEVQTVTLGRNATGNIQLTGEVNPLNGKTHILLRSNLTSLRNNHQAALRIVPVSGSGQIDLWADDKKLHFNHVREGFTVHTTESTITELGGTAHRILSVGAYTTRDAFLLEGDPVTHPVGMFLDDLCSFSGFGPTADGRQKPDVCAPGSFIVSSISGHDVTEIYMHSHYTDADGHPQRYGYMQGTSMSTPFVTGAVALWLQAYPSLTPEQLRDVVAQTSRTDGFTASPRLWGSGKVDVKAGVERCLELAADDAILPVQLPTLTPDGIYDAAGRRVSGLQAPGFYVVRSGRQAHKVSIR